MTGPARDDIPDRIFSDDIDNGPPDSIPPKPDPWDEPDIEVPTDVEDIAIVCHEALRAYRTTQGGGSGFPWMHRTTAERAHMLKMVKAVQEPGTVIDDDAETRLIAAIVKALTP